MKNNETKFENQIEILIKLRRYNICQRREEGNHCEW